MGQPTIQEIEVTRIHPSPYQQRKHFGREALAELAKSIDRDGLIEPIVVRPNADGYELIAGERRWRAVSELTEQPTILTRIVEVGDLQARRMCAAENLQREDLSPVEQVEALVELIDAELIEDPEYAALGCAPEERVRELLGALQAVDTNGTAGRSVSRRASELTHKFMCNVEGIFAGLPRPMGWKSFYVNDLPLVTRLDDDVRNVAICNKLSKSQAKALNEVKRVDPTAYRRLTMNRDDDGAVELPLAERTVDAEGLRDLSAKEIRQFAGPDKRELGALVNGPKLTPQLPEGQWNLIYADPPWRYEFVVDSNDAIENHYPTMDVDDICDLDVPSITAGDAVIFLWTTAPKLPEGLKVLEAWGFRYSTCIIWEKSGLGMGLYARINHEILLIGAKGSPGVPLPANRPASVVKEPKEEHSRKPEAFRTLIETMYPTAKRIELFRRGDAPRGWSVWGNEAEV